MEKNSIESLQNRQLGQLWDNWGQSPIVPFSQFGTELEKGEIEMKYTYIPKGVCSRQMEIEVENGIVTKLEIIGGCHGNLQGIAKLVKGMKIEEVIKRLKGIDCRREGYLLSRPNCKSTRRNKIEYRWRNANDSISYW